jgi:hypothetical protein
MLNRGGLDDSNVHRLVFGANMEGRADSGSGVYGRFR